MKILLLAASVRTGSVNGQLMDSVGQYLSKKEGLQIFRPHFRDFSMPVYDGDLESSSGIPEGALSLGRAIMEADALIVSTPEYNGGIPGPLKNAIDWVSRIKPMPLKGKPLLLMAASPGALGGTRSLWHTRVPFEVMGTWVFPEMFSLPRAHQAFDANGEISDLPLKERLEELLEAYIRFLRNGVKPS